MRAQAYRAGFTLIEVLVALVLGGIILLVVHASLGQLANGERLTVAAATESDRVANGERLLRALVGRVDGATAVPGAVQGTAEETDLTTWCEVPRGWLEHCHVRLSFASGEDGPALRVRLPGSHPSVALIAGFRTGRFLYLSDAHNGGTWLTDWPSKLTTPLALGVVLDRDTLILPIGERG